MALFNAASSRELQRSIGQFVKDVLQGDLPITIWTRSHTDYRYWKTGKQSQQYKLSEIKQASVKRSETLTEKLYL